MPSSTSLRLPAPLKAQAMAYAEALGISLNALCAVALRDYLDSRTMTAESKRTVQPAPILGTPAPEVVPVLRTIYAKPAGGVNDPCPCGSGQKWKKCHGKPGAL